MSNDFGTRAGLQDFLSRSQARIKEHGCVIVWAPTDHSACMPPFGYSVGLSAQFRMPELLVFGLSHDDSLIVLNTLLRRYLRPGFSVPVNDPIPGVLEHRQVIVKSVPIEKARQFTRIAIEYCSYLQRQCRVQQVVVPDLRGKFPWETGYNRRQDRLQPLLFEFQ